MNKRNEIVSAIVALLVPVLPAITIYNSRVLKVTADDLPFISVYGAGDTAERSSDTIYKTTEEIHIRVSVKGLDITEVIQAGSGTTAEEDLNVIINTIEETLQKKRQSLGIRILTFDKIYQNIEAGIDGEDLIASVDMQYDVMYIEADT